MEKKNTKHSLFSAKSSKFVIEIHINYEFFEKNGKNKLKELFNFISVLESFQNLKNYVNINYFLVFRIV